MSLSQLPKKVLVVDDHAIVRAALVCELQKYARSFEVIGEAGDIVSTLKLASSFCPQIIFLDHSLAESTGLEVISELRKINIDLQVVIFTQCHNPHILRSYWDAGVLGLIDKSSTMLDLEVAFSALSRGNRYLSDSFKHLLFKADQKLLSKRELEVVAMVAKGLSNKEVAGVLSCSDQTIKTHKSNIMKKLGVDSSVELGVWATENGLS